MTGLHHCFQTIIDRQTTEHTSGQITEILFIFLQAQAATTTIMNKIPQPQLCLKPLLEDQQLLRNQSKDHGEDKEVLQ